MMEVDVEEPLQAYTSFFRERHARHVSEHFEDLVRASKVDEQANIKTVGELRAAQEELSRQSSKRMWLRVARVATIAAMAGGVFVAFDRQGWASLLLLPALAAVFLVFTKINPAVTALNREVEDLEKRGEALSTQAWEQMEPLNVLHEWGTAQRLFSKTFPLVRFDPYFSDGRLGDLMQNFGLPSDTHQGRSVLYAQSGSINGNPFVLSRFLEHWIGTKTYFGSLTIYWTEQVRNSEGRWETVQRSQTLTASVTKPFPEYGTRTTLFYGHEAAPNLSFSRRPSKLSGLEDGALNDWRKERAAKKVERRARHDVKTGEGNLTAMSNREFEALFGALDRDDEIAFRLLFTPLAQQQVTLLLNDRAAGYGDDFSFVKQRRINLIEPGHMREMAIDGDPRKFRALELAESRRSFQAFHESYFRALYFAFAPLLAIPLYRDGRSLPTTSEDPQPCPWEHEAMANYIGGDRFKHPDSATLNLLKTTKREGQGTAAAVSVTAYGYEGIPRLDHVRMAGGDGNIHAVPVHWTEYIPVERTSGMLVGVAADPSQPVAPERPTLERGDDWTEAARRFGVDPQNFILRGQVLGAPFGE